MAASSNSFGILIKYWRSRNTSYALAKNAGTISGSHVPVQPILLKIMNSGMIVACGGRIIVEIRRMNRMFLPGIGKRAKP
jgi:hypothetical protein